ncbi:flippase-like domain-containing protein [Candidatus Woesearchaeota archaeon]|nr:flippase-like domain-containing protein [Candidatus Woesearchaeota archaeon]
MLKFRHWALETLLVGIFIVALITWQLGFHDIVGVLADVSIFFLGCYLVVSLLLALGLTLKWMLVLKSQGMHVPFHRLFAYRLVGFTVGYLTPTMHAGSEPIRAFLLKREGIPLDKAFSNVIIDKSIELLANVLFFFLGALLILNSVLVDKPTKIFVLGASLVLMLLMGLFIAGILHKKSMFLRTFRFLRLHKFKRLSLVEGNLVKVERQVGDFYRKKKKYFLGLFVMMMGLWVLMYFEYRFVLLLLGQEANVVQIFLILTGVGIAYSIPIPAAMGTLELGQLSAAKVLQLGSVLGIALAFIIRARDLLWTMLGLVFMGFYNFRFRKLAAESSQIEKDFEKGKLYKRRKV